MIEEERAEVRDAMEAIEATGVADVTEAMDVTGVAEMSKAPVTDKPESAVQELALAVRRAFGLKAEDIRTYSPLTLAYIGDGIYDMIIRTILVERSNAQVNKLHKKASNYVKAQAQKELYHAIEADLDEEEKSVFKRGRNAKSATAAKNASISDYRTATGIEALFGYLYLTGRTERIFELLRKGFPQLCGDPAQEREEGGLHSDEI